MAKKKKNSSEWKQGVGTINVVHGGGGAGGTGGQMIIKVGPDSKLTDTEVLKINLECERDRVKKLTHEVEILNAEKRLLTSIIKDSMKSYSY